MKTFHLPMLAVMALGCAPLCAQSSPATPPPQQGETWTRELAEPVQRGKLQDAFQFVRGDTGKWSDEPKLLCAPLTDKPSKTSLDEWFDQMERRRGAPPRADEDAWLLFRTRQFDDNDRIWIERIERRGKRISIVMNEAIWQGKYFKTFTFYQTYGINLGKLAPGEYSVDWTIRSRAFRQFAGEGKPTPENWPNDDAPAEKKPVVITMKISVASEPPKVGAASERR